jgi:hypothetical protein
MGKEKPANPTKTSDDCATLFSLLNALGDTQQKLTVSNCCDFFICAASNKLISLYSS